MKITGNPIQRVDIIPERFWFVLVESKGIYSVYHHCDGSYGQKNFGTNQEGATRHLDSQRRWRNYYLELIGKRDKLVSRMAPISKKLDMVTLQIKAGILR